MKNPLLNFEGGPGVLFLIFEGGHEVPLLNFEGGSRGSRSWGSGRTFTPCPIQRICIDLATCLVNILATKFKLLKLFNV